MLPVKAGRGGGARGVRVGVAMESLAVHKASVSFKFKLIGGVETRSSCSTSTCGRRRTPSSLLAARHCWARDGGDTRGLGSKRTTKGSCF
ncbi:hypothetical protein OsJ_21663 [Oryza sativa Japonica Group]|uniref:Uncharacterized protein n=1 Tax=Oryza sativa subsp. japonica TaxID=39947 RepID=B9FTQ8_ORYSJ|nr:hypothetical protein OsJ_21663 [Oryza sativa Japonica Group]